MYNPNTSVLINNGSLSFELRSLPVEAQLSPVFGTIALDYNGNREQDLLLTGNFYDVLPEIGRYDANRGLLLEGVGKGKYRSVLPSQSGFQVQGQVRKMRLVRGANGRQMLVLAKNNDSAQVFLLPEVAGTIIQ